MRLKETLEKENRIDHIKNPTGKFLARKDEILNKFKIKQDLLSKAEQMYFGNEIQKMNSLQ